MKTTLFRIMALASLLVFGTVFCLSAEDVSASISKITGKVEIQTANGWAPAKVGQTINAGTTISTGFRSTAELTLGTAIVTVKALTRLTLAELAENAGVVTTNLNLRVGKVSAEVKTVAGKTNDFKVKSPISTASVRGTGFDFDGESLVVTHGVVEFADNIGNKVSVPIGETVRTSASGGGVVNNQAIMKEETTTVADAGSDFGNSDATAFADPGSDVTIVSDFSDFLDFTEILNSFQDNYVARTGKLTITIK